MPSAVLATVLASCGAALAAAFYRGRLLAPGGQEVYLPEAAQLAGVELCLGSAWGFVHPTDLSCPVSLCSVPGRLCLLLHSSR